MLYFARRITFLKRQQVSIGVCLHPAIACNVYIYRRITILNYLFIMNVYAGRINVECNIGFLFFYFSFFYWFMAKKYIVLLSDQCHNFCVNNLVNLLIYQAYFQRL